MYERPSRYFNVLATALATISERHSVPCAYARRDYNARFEVKRNKPKETINVIVIIIFVVILIILIIINT